MFQKQPLDFIWDQEKLRKEKWDAATETMLFAATGMDIWIVIINPYLVDEIIKNNIAYGLNPCSLNLSQQR